MKWSRSRGVDVEVVERLEVLGGAPRDRDAGLVGLADVAAPELVHAAEHVVLGTPRAVVVDERDDEGVLRLAGGEAALRDLASPAERLELLDHPCPGRGPDERRDLAEPRHALVGDARLDLVRAPAARHHRRPHPDAEGALRAEVLGHRRQPVAEVVGDLSPGPVEHRALGQVGEVAPQLRELAVEHEADTDEQVAVVPTQRLAAPLRLDRGPRRRLQEARPRLRADERAVLVGGDRTDGRNHGVEATGVYQRRRSGAPRGRMAARPHIQREAGNPPGHDTQGHTTVDLAPMTQPARCSGDRSDDRRCRRRPAPACSCEGIDLAVTSRGGIR